MDIPHDFLTASPSEWAPGDVYEDLMRYMARLELHADVVLGDDWVMVVISCERC